MNRYRLLAPVLCLLLLAGSAAAELRVSNLFTDHMVLQQEMPIRVWGWAEPGQRVTVVLGDSSNLTTTGDDGKWMAELPALKADGKAHTLRIVSGEKTIEFKDILLGEVWICSGQSNMEWPVARCANPQEEIKNANYPMIRMFNVPKHVKQNAPQSDAQIAQWQVCSPSTVSGFSACGYYFGRSLHQKLNVPIGLVGTNWGGTRIEPWTPPVGFESVPELEPIAMRLRAMDPATPEGIAARRAYVEQVENWLNNAKAHAQTGKETGSAPQLNVSAPAEATQIYNGMVAGLTPMSARGVIWYQGESNARDGLAYNYLKEGLVLGWRDVFQNDDLSFYWVQLADFGRGHAGSPEGGGWGPVREGQRRALRIPDTGMATIIDIGDKGDIHPKNKQDIGKRLALIALAKDYDQEIVYSGPMYKSHAIQGDKVVVSFHLYGSKGLATGNKGGEHRLAPVQYTDTNELKSFSIRDDQGNWHWAKAVIQGDTVVVSSDKVDKPTAVRYAYDSDPEVNFYNKEGLPAVPFTTTD